MLMAHYSEDCDNNECNYACIDSGYTGGFCLEDGNCECYY
jgi:hypothetical protein